MLVEIEDVRQIPNEGFRRWFTDADLDLIIWYEEDLIVGFQLCYGYKEYNERALTWHRGGHYMHNGIDNGESPYSTKMTPILVSDEVFNKTEVSDKFIKNAMGMEHGLVDFINKIILEYS